MRIKVLSGGRKSIELPLSDAELNFQMKRIGIEETVPVCRLVEASEKDNPLCKFERQTVNMDEVNFFAKRMDCLTEYERKVLYSYVTDYGVGTMQDLINLTFSMKGLSLITDFSDAEQVGKRLYLDEFIAMSEEEKQQTNFIKFAEKTFKESRVEVLPYGVFVEHGFEMQEVYNGKTFPEYFASDEIVAAIEVQNQAGDIEYLYLPTDICSMNKSAVTRKKNQKSKFSSEYALTGLLLCGQEYRRVTWSRNVKKKIVWRCSNRLTNGTKHCKKSETLEEGALNRAVMSVINRITCNDGDFVGAFRQNVIRVIGNYGLEQEPDEYDDKIKAKQEEMVALIAENAKEGSYTDEFDERYRKIAEEISTLKEEQIETRRKKKLADNYEQRLRDMDSFLQSQTCQIPEFDNDLVRRLIANIKVVSADKLIIQFQSGIVMEQEISYD